MFAPQRHEAILSLLRETGRVSSSELSRKLAVSEDTIRRDLATLASEGQLVRTHGGAVPRSTTKLEFQARSQENLAEKDALARAAAPLIKNGQVVYFDAGSTVLALARALPADLAFTAVTHSLPAAIALSELPQTEVLLLGGRVLKRGLATVGAEPVRACQHIQADLAFMSIAAVDPENGITDPSHEESEMKRALIANAAKVVVLATTGKLGRACPFRVAPATTIDLLLTDADAPADVVQRFRAIGVEVATASRSPSVSTP